MQTVTFGPSPACRTRTGVVVGHHGRGYRNLTHTVPEPVVPTSHLQFGALLNEPTATTTPAGACYPTHGTLGLRVVLRGTLVDDHAFRIFYPYLPPTMDNTTLPPGRLARLRSGSEFWLHPRTAPGAVATGALTRTCACDVGYAVGGRTDTATTTPAIPTHTRHHPLQHIRWLTFRLAFDGHLPVAPRAVTWFTPLRFAGSVEVGGVLRNTDSIRTAFVYCFEPSASHVT